MLGLGSPTMLLARMTSRRLRVLPGVVISTYLSPKRKKCQRSWRIECYAKATSGALYCMQSTPQRPLLDRQARALVPNSSLKKVNVKFGPLTDTCSTDSRMILALS